MDLLLTKDEKTYIIAEKVGYSDPNYFSYVFKKQFGMSPSKYKVSWAKSENNRKILPENSGIPCKTCQTPDDTVYDIGFIYDCLCMQYGDSWRDTL